MKHSKGKTWKPIGSRAYLKLTTGAFYERYKDENGEWKWKTLGATKAHLAREEAEANSTRRARIKAGLEKETSAAIPKSIGELCRAYAAAGCPDRNLNERPTKTKYQEGQRLIRIEEWWGRKLVTDITKESCGAYIKWRSENARKGSKGARAADLELNTLTNVFAHAGITPNPLMGRIRPWSKTKAVHCRERAPEDANQLHTLAEMLFKDPHSEVLGWQLLFEGLSGCRTGEILKLRVDATKRTEPGFVEQNKWLWIDRLKKGVNPWIILKDRPEFQELILAHRNWLKKRFPESVWYFPSPRIKGQTVDKDILSKNLKKISHVVNDNVLTMTSHGMRAFYVLVRRSQGASDGQIAAEIGDRTISLIEDTYGALPPNWQGGEEINFLPTEGLPAWHPWLPKEGQPIQIVPHPGFATPSPQSESERVLS